MRNKERKLQKSAINEMKSGASGGEAWSTRFSGNYKKLYQNFHQENSNRKDENINSNLALTHAVKMFQH